MDLDPANIANRAIYARAPGDVMFDYIKYWIHGLGQQTGVVWWIGLLLCVARFFARYSDATLSYFFIIMARLEVRFFIVFFRADFKSAIGS